LLRDPADYFLEYGLQEFFVNVAFVAQREIEVLRKPVRFEVALLEAGAAFEDPAFRKFVMCINAGEYPAENVILLDDIGQQRKGRSGFEDFAAVYHAA
jgi:hypothetical protein